MKGKIVGHETKGPNGLPVIMIEIANFADIAGFRLNKEVELKRLQTRLHAIVYQLDEYIKELDGKIK